MDRSLATSGLSPGAVVLAGAIPFLFLHARYNPGFEVGSVGVELSDLAALAVVLAGAVEARHGGLARLRRGVVPLALGAALTALVLLSTLYGPAVTDGYPFGTSLVSALTFAEYALLAPAVALVLRTGADVALVAVVTVAWSVLASAVGVLQVIGALGNLDGTPAGRRMPSLLGFHDFAALSGAALGIALALVVLGAGARPARRLAVAAATGGAVGIVVSGSLAAVLGAVVATGALALIAWRRESLTLRRAAVAGLLVTGVLAGTLALRSGDVSDFLGFLGDDEPTADIETYSQRTVLLYIGGRIFLAHPVLGTGWQGSVLEPSYGPFLDDARRRFPDVAPEAFPSPERPWGVQNAYVQAAADMGVAGVALLVGLVLAAAALAVRTALRRDLDWAAPSLAALASLLVAAAELAALGLVPGVPTTALLWIAIGVAVASARAADERRRSRTD